jgi:RNA polymerase sigma factor (sigma-70 family)
MGEMHEKSDAQLLRGYAQHGDEAAFAELVNRHTNLVYSAAARQVDSPDLAAEVAQSAFIGLARGAQSLSPRLTEDASLAGWLCRSARNISLNLRRDEFRRHSRERQAMEHFNPISETATDWERLRPVLDDAMSALDETDYDALVMRYFKNQHLRSVGLALGVSDDTAQKRISRALDKLREHLSRRGINTTATALSGVLTANAVQAAPVGLAVTISTAATLAGTTIATTATATKAIAMTTLQKTLIAATLVAAVGTGIYEARQASNLRDEVQSLQQQQTLLAEQLRQKRDGATSRLAALLAENEQLKSKQNTTELLKLRGEVTRLRTDASDPTDATAKALVAKVNKLKQRLEETPSAKIPELQFVAEKDWLNAARGDLETDADYRQALSTLRNTGENKVAVMLKKSLARYMQSNNKQFPTDLGQLQSYFDSPLDDAILQRWQIASAATIKSLGMGGDVIITQKAPVDDVFDTRYGIGPNGYGSTDFLNQETEGTMRPVSEAFRAAHKGEWPDDLSQLQPYVTTPEQQVALQKLMMRNSVGK